MVDKEKLEKVLRKFISTWEDKINNEKKYLREKQVNLVISDIVPWIFKALKDVGDKSILISKFIWTEIYNEIFNNDIGAIYEDYYKKADYAFIYTLAGDINKYFNNVIKV
ncbi:hypothetical protein [Thermoanaerobacterium sp. RBIITD]|uniref:hypothetical protein n=1 Tax=Thermoanaerobacterium sp. RBIITD TaxID=1550240 RepID=UPI000BB785CA|nr:hypothetical protein [Thermoanaerobacterium sp. RBIITD]